MPDPAYEQLRVSVLGPLRAWYGDQELNLGPARQRSLFAVLVADANRLVSRDEIIEAVWGAAAPATAPGSVYTYVSGLRRVLAPGDDRRAAAAVLTSGPAGYSLRIAPGHLDSDRFSELCARAAELRAAHDPGEAAVLDEALRLWHGDAYAGLSGDRLELERTRLTEQRLAAVERRARIAMELGDDGLIAELAGLVRDHPLHEPLHELLIQALYRAGRSAEALEAFRAARRTLVSELGVEPGPALRELQRRVLDGSMAATEPPALPAAVVPIQVARAIRDGLTDRPLVGRGDEVELLRGLVRAAAQGTGAAVWIEGEPGIGKTEVLTRALSDA